MNNFLNPIFIVTQIIPLIIIATGICYFVYDRYIRRYIKIHILKQIKDQWFLIHIKKLKMKTETYFWKGKTYVIETSLNITDKQNRPQIYYDIDNVNPIGFSIFEKTYKYNPKNLTRVLRAHLVEEFLGTSKDKLLVIIIIVLIIAVVAIAIFSNYQMNILNDKIIQLLKAQIPIEVIEG